MGGTEKKGREAKILKKGQAGSRDGCLEKGRGAGTPLQNYDVYIYIIAGK